MRQTRVIACWTGCGWKAFDRRSQHILGFGVTSCFEQAMCSLVVTSSVPGIVRTRPGPSVARGDQITPALRDVGPGHGDFKVVRLDARRILQPGFGLVEPPQSDQTAGTTCFPLTRIPHAANDNCPAFQRFLDIAARFGDPREARRSRHSRNHGSTYSLSTVSLPAARHAASQTSVHADNDKS
jgi:hypothetical protein